MHYQSIDIDCKVRVVILLDDYRMKIMCGMSWKISLWGFTHDICRHSHGHIISSSSWVVQRVVVYNKSSRRQFSKSLARNWWLDRVELVYFNPNGWNRVYSWKLLVFRIHPQGSYATVDCNFTRTDGRSLEVPSASSHWGHQGVTWFHHLCRVWQSCSSFCDI